jgi:hypothetical protein
MGVWGEKTMTNYVKDDDPVAQEIADKEDTAKKETKKKYGHEHKTTCFHEDILCNKEHNGHN